MDKQIKEGKVMYCECGGPVKPNITFFGEQLPQKFRDVLGTIANDGIDLMFVIGTALAVAPFNFVVKRTECPQVLLNMNNNHT